jgi:hypothetical protein
MIFFGGEGLFFFVLFFFGNLFFSSWFVAEARPGGEMRSLLLELGQLIQSYLQSSRDSAAVVLHALKMSQKETAKRRKANKEFSEMLGGMP